MKYRDWKTGGGYLRGIDISSNQGTINPSKLKSSGIKFVILRAYGSNHSAGGDSKMKEYYTGLKAVGIPCGSYMYVMIPSNGDLATARSQANLYADKLESVFGAGKWGELLPFMDLEGNESVGGHHSTMNTTTMINWVKEYRKTFEARFGGKVKLGLYSSWSFIKDHNNFNNGALKDMPLWIAKWRTTSIGDVGGWTTWVAWQYTDNAYPFSKGTSAGVGSIGLDMDYVESLDHIRSTYNAPIDASTPKAILNTNNTISVSWTSPTVSGVTKIELYRNQELYKTFDKSVKLFLDSSLEFGRTYDYFIKVYTANGNAQSKLSNVVKTIVPRPSVPQGLTVYPRDRSLVISWIPNPIAEEITSYTLNISGRPPLQLKQTGTTLYDLINGAEYSFSVIAHNDNPTASGVSPSVKGTPVTDYPNPPVDLQTTITSTKNIVVSWVHAPKTDFSHFRGYVNNELIFDNYKELQITLSGLEVDQPYDIRIEAVDTQGDFTSSTTKTRVIHQPAQVTGLKANPKDRSVELSWDDVLFDIPNPLPDPVDPPPTDGEPAVAEPPIEELIVPVPPLPEPPNPPTDEVKTLEEPEPEVIIVPPTTPPPQPSGTIVWTIKAGDTLYSIATKTGTTTAKLQEYNPTLVPERLIVGEKIYTPPIKIPDPKYDLLTYDELKEQALALTALMETSTGYPYAYGVSAGNFDGAGMSFGAIQFNIKSDTLQSILKSMFNTYRTVTKTAWHYSSDPTPFNNMDYYVNRASKSSFMNWANSISSSSNKHKLKEPYATYMKNMGITKECIALQVKHAESYFNQALKYFNDFGLWSRRGFALMFDIAVQSWSIASSTKSLILSDFAKISKTGKTDAQIEQAKLVIIANRRGDAVSSRWRSIWKQRKLAIANGSGTVYGSLKVDTNKYNMILEPAFSNNVPNQFEIAEEFYIDTDAYIKEDGEEISPTFTTKDETKDVYLQNYLLFMNGNYLATVDPTVTTFTVNGLQNGVEYSFSVQAISNQDVRGNMSNPITVSPVIDYPNKAEGLNAEVVDRTTIKFTWEHIPTENFSYFDVLVNDKEVLVNTQLKEYTYSGAIENFDYKLEVISYDTDGDSVTSGTISTRINTPQKPTGLKVIPKDKEVILSWDLNPEPFVTQYRIYINDEVDTVIESPISSYKIIDLINDINYSFKIEAVTDMGFTSPMSDIVYATTKLDIPNKPIINQKYSELGNGGVEISWEHIQKEYHGYYNIYKDGYIYARNIQDKIFQTDYLEPNTTHSFQVEAFDTQGDRSGFSESIYVTIYSKIFEPLSVELGKISEDVKVIKPNLYLCNPNKRTISKLSEAYNITYNTKYADLNEINFILPYTVENNFLLEKNRNYDITKERFLIRLELGKTIEYFTINEITNSSENNGKTIHAWSLGYELKDKLVNNLNEEITTAHSAMLFALDTVPNWEIGANIKNEDFFWNQETRIFAVANTTVLDFIQTIAKSYNAIIVWDTVNRIVDFENPTLQAENKGLKIKYGKYLKTISKSSTVEEMVTQLRPIGENNLSISDATVNGSDVLEDFSFFMNGYEKDENGIVISHSPYMSDELCESQIAYSELLDSHEEEFHGLLDSKRVKNDELVELNYDKSESETTLLMVQDLLTSLKTEGSYFYEEVLYGGIYKEFSFTLDKDYKYLLLGKQVDFANATFPIDMQPFIVNDLKGNATFNGVNIGGYFTGEFNINQDQNGAYQEGEIRVNVTGGNVLYHPNGNSYTIPSGTLITTHFEGTDIRATGKAYIMYVGTDFTRFTTITSANWSREFVYAFNNNGQWQYGNNSYTLTNFTPNENDLIVGQFERLSTTSIGIESLTEFSQNIIKTSKGVKTFSSDEEWKVLEKISFDRTGESTVDSTINTYSYLLKFYGEQTSSFAFQLNRILADEYNAVDNEATLLTTYGEEKAQRDFDEKSLLVTDKETEIAVVDTDIETLQDSLSIYSNFTPELLLERDLFVIEKEYTDEKIANPEELKNRALEKFKELKNPTITINIDIVNLLEVLEEHYNWHKLEIGTIINVFYEKFDISIQAQIVEMNFDFTNKTISLTISNVKDIKTNQEKFIDSLYKAITTSTTVSIEKNNWSKAMEVKESFDSFVNNAFDATKQKIIAGMNETVEISRRGILIKSDVDPNSMLVANASVIAITNDGGKNYKNAITTEGVIGERIIGKILAGENLVIENEAGTFKVDKDGVTISNQSLNITGGLTQDQFSETVNFTGELSGIAKDYIDTYKENIDIATIPNSPTLTTTVGTVTQYTNVTTDLVNLSYDWTFPIDENPASNIDGFIIYMYSSSSSALYTFGSNPKQEISFYVKPDKRSIILQNVPKNMFYTFGIEAYRVVNTTINPTGVLKSPIISVTAPYNPNLNTAYVGDITGTVNFNQMVKVKPEIMTAIRLGQSYDNVTIDTVNGIQVVDKNNTQKVFLNSNGFKIQTNSGTGFVDKLTVTSTGILADDLTTKRLIVNDTTGQTLINANTKTINFANFTTITGNIQAKNIDAFGLNIVHKTSGVTTFGIDNTGNVTVAGNITMTGGSISWTNITKPTYTASEVGARPSTWTPTATDVGARPSTWTPTATDVGARPSNWFPNYTELLGTKPPTNANNTYSELMSNANIKGFYYNPTTNRLEIFADNITAGNLNADLITVGDLNADLITFGTLDGAKATIRNLDATNIVTGTMSFDRSQGGTLVLGGAIIGIDDKEQNIFNNGILTIKNSNDEEIATLNGDYGGFSQLRIDKLLNTNNVVFQTDVESPNITGGNLVYYVDPQYGNDDETTTGLSTDPFETISYLISKLPKYLDRDVTIYVRPILLKETELRINGFVGVGKITILKWALNIRYVRDSISGNTVNTGNHWVELEAIKTDGNKVGGITENQVNTSRIDSEALVPEANRTYINGIVRGGIFTGTFIADQTYEAVSNNGEIKIDTTLGNRFFHPNGNVYTVATGNIEMSTSLEDNTPAKMGYICYVGTDKARFTLPYAWDSTDFAVVYYNNGRWEYDNNSATGVPFTPNENDCLVATVGRSTSTALGIDTLTEFATTPTDFKKLALLVNGDKTTSNYMGISQPTAYVDVYLNGSYTNLRKINVWHYYYDTRSYHNNITQVSEDRVKWYTIFDSNEQGEYIETSAGHTIYVDKALLNGYIKVDSNGCEVEIKDIYVQAKGTGLPAVYGYNTQWFTLTSSIIMGDTTYPYAYYCSGSNCRINYSEVNYASSSCVISAYGGRLELIDVTGGGAKYGMYAHGSGLIGGYGKSPQGTDATYPKIIKLYGGTYTVPDTGTGSHIATLGENSPQPATPPPATTTTTTVTRTKTWTSTGGASWNGGSGSWHTADSDVLQGKYSSFGLYRGLWFFPSDMRNTCNDAKSITKIRFYFTRANSSGVVSNAVHQIRTHGYLSKPSSAPSYNPDYVQVVADRGQSQWVDITSKFKDDFLAGSVYGICLYTASTSSSYYTRCSHTAKIEVTYTVTVTT